MPGIIIVDLESTCWQRTECAIPEQRSNYMEIIEIGAVHWDGIVRDQWQFFVQPVLYPDLSNFCKEVTNIRQEDVDAAHTFPAVFQNFASWIEEKKVDTWGSWGDYDRNQFTRDADRHEVFNVMSALYHINIKDNYCNIKGVSKRKAGLRLAIERLGLEFEGTPHRGIDDAKNIAKIYSFINTNHPEASWQATPPDFIM